MCDRKFFTDLLSSSSTDNEQTIPSSIESMEASSSLAATTKSNPQDMVQLEGEDATNASRKRYELCDVGHKQNHEPMVASGKYNVLSPLSQCLTHSHNQEKLHFVCLTLNNLAIPHDNKRVMVLERGSKS